MYSKWLTQGGLNSLLTITDEIVTISLSDLNIGIKATSYKTTRVKLIKVFKISKFKNFKWPSCAKENYSLSECIHVDTCIQKISHQGWFTRDNRVLAMLKWRTMGWWSE